MQNALLNASDSPARRNAARGIPIPRAFGGRAYEDSSTPHKARRSCRKNWRKQGMLIRSSKAKEGMKAQIKEKC